MTSLTDEEGNRLSREFNRELAAREELTRTELMLWERVIGALTVAVVLFLSAKWWQVLPMPAVVLLATCATAMPYIYFEFKRLRRQVNALTQLVLHAKRSE